MEIWKDIKGYEGLYRISDRGNILIVRTHKHRSLWKKTGKNYYFIDLWNKGVKKNFAVHRLVATHFIDNPEEKPEVHHIDHNPENNNVSNLMWVTGEENRAFYLSFLFCLYICSTTYTDIV